MESMPDMTPREMALREDLSREYYALNDAVASADGRLMTVKGWSVTLSLAALGLGFQQSHYALFGLAAVTAASFWFLDGLIKGHQVRYYGRLRDIEVAANALNAVELGELGEVSSPRINMSWGFRGQQQVPDCRNGPPTRLTAQVTRRVLRRRFVLPNVMFPHLAAVILGSVLFVAAASDAWGLSALTP